jgi:hypothetical protein
MKAGLRHGLKLGFSPAKSNLHRCSVVAEVIARLNSGGGEGHIRNQDANFLGLTPWFCDYLVTFSAAI